MSNRLVSAEAATNTGFLDRAGCWLIDSGIQEPNGGVARYYLADSGQNRAVSTEITGYAVSALTYLHSLTKDERYRDAAVRSASFLTRVAFRALRQDRCSVVGYFGVAAAV